MRLRDYQLRYINKVRQAYLSGYKSPCVVAPCGAGKSVIIGEIVRRTASNQNNVLFLVHRKELCDQIEETFERLSVPKESYRLGMVQTVSRRLGSIERPGLIITDENHHGLAASYRKIYDHFSDVLRLGFTATPIRLNGSGLGAVNDILIEEVTAKWLIENDYLAPYRYFAPKLINENYLKLNKIRDFSSQSINDSMKENRTIFGDVVKHYIDLAKGEKAICYCHSVDASLEMAEEFQANGIAAEHLDAKTPKDERRQVIQNFREGKIKILTNVDLIGEGFDVPDCSTVILLRPTQSLSLYIQQSMRGMRHKPGKTSIIIDHVGNIHRFGPPDLERTWNLAEKEQKEPEIKIKTCSYCFNVYAANMKSCPHCGKLPVIKERDRELEIVKSEQLEEIKQSFILNYKEPHECKSIQELSDIAKSRNYKKGWVYHQAKILGILK